MIESLLGGWSPAGHPTWMQTAAEGRWEQARGLHTPAAADAVRALVREWGDGDVAVEYEWLGHPLVFVGARPASEDAAVRVARDSPSDPEAALAALAGGPPSGLASIELGAVNAWRSVGPLRLWSAGDAPRTGAVDELLDGRPDLRSCSVPVALELAFRLPRACWIGREVSEATDGGHVTDAALVEMLLDRVLASVA